MSGLQSVVIDRDDEGQWRAFHVPSGKISYGQTKAEAEKSMRDLLGLNEHGNFEEPLTSDRFSGEAREVALFLEGPISKMLAAHAGYARLESYRDGICEIRLGGGCQGCPASQMTLLHGVKGQLEEQFGEHVVADVIPAAS